MLWIYNVYNKVLFNLESQPSYWLSQRRQASWQIYHLRVKNDLSQNCIFLWTFTFRRSHYCGWWIRGECHQLNRIVSLLDVHPSHSWRHLYIYIVWPKPKTHTRDKGKKRFLFVDQHIPFTIFRCQHLIKGSKLFSVATSTGKAWLQRCYTMDDIGGHSTCAVWSKVTTTTHLTSYILLWCDFSLFLRHVHLKLTQSLESRKFAPKRSKQHVGLDGLKQLCVGLKVVKEQRVTLPLRVELSKGLALRFGARWWAFPRRQELQALSKISDFVWFGR